MPYPVTTPDLSQAPFSFSAFVAERRGLSQAQAEQLLTKWLETYEPSLRPSAETDPKSAPPPRSDELRFCA